MDLGIAGKRALVCAASKGLGRGCAQALADAGCEVTIVARTETDLLRRRRKRSAPAPAAPGALGRRRHHDAAGRRGGARACRGARHPRQQRRRTAARATFATGTATRGSARSTPTC